MKVALISSPYDLGREGSGMAEGPSRYLEAGAAESLSGPGFEVEVGVVKRRGPFVDELDATAEANAEVAMRIGEAVGAGAFPLVLGGNCDTALGVLAGIGPGDAGIFWFDAHGDFNTPENSTSGYLGGMALATVTGNCHGRLRFRIGANSPVPESRVVMAGVRDVEAEQRPLLENSGITVIGADAMRANLAASLNGPLASLESQTRKIYLHLDVDSLDPSHAPGVDFPAPGGLSPEEVEAAIDALAGRFEIHAASLTAFNPENDVNDKTLRLGVRMMRTIVQAVSKSRAERA